jgi:hypothetical protein
MVILPVNQSIFAGPAGGNQDVEIAAILSSNSSHTPPVTGALGVIGLSGRIDLT